jgi:small subunit ribosomal protein S9
MTAKKRVTSKKSVKTPAKKTVVKKVEPQKTEVQRERSSSKYYAVGRRKESVARVYYHISPNQEVQVNNKPVEQYFTQALHKNLVLSPFSAAGFAKGKWMIRVVGGGLKGQAESVRLGISRLLVKLDEVHKPILKKMKFLTRDPRVKERKKYGLKRARRAPQWQKR